MKNRAVLRRAARAGLLSAVLFGLLSSTAAVTLVRAASSIEMQIRALVGGRYEVGGWAAIAVTLVNDGEPTQGNLFAETESGAVQRFVEMPAGARKVVMLYVEPQAFQRRVTVEYQEPNGTVEAEVEVRAFEQSGTQVGIVGDGTGALRTQITGALDENASEPLSLSAADIPERPEPLDGIDSLVWAADSSGLTEPQRRSLERWVAAGGELIVVGGADWQARTDAFADLLPVSDLAAFDGVPQTAVAAWSGSAEPAVAADTVSSGALHEEARALITAEDGTLLLSMRPVGAGRTIVVGSDLGTEAYRTWEGSPRIWSRLIPNDMGFEQFFGGFPVEGEAFNAMSGALSNLPSLEVPPAELLLAVIVGYILLIGPISYVILRRVDRREAAWITAPVLVVLFSACSYGIGNSLKGSDVITNQISLIHTSSAGGVAAVESYAGVFSPQRATYDLRVEADALLASVQPTMFDVRQTRRGTVTVEQGNPARLRDLAIGVFGFETVRADAVVDYEPALSVTWRRDDEGDLAGTVTNTGEVPLSDVAYVSSSIGERIGDLAPGQEAEFELPRTNFNGSSAADQVYGFGGFDPTDAGQREETTRRQVIDALVGFGGFMGPGAVMPSSSERGPFIIGWRADEGPLPVLVDDLTTQQYHQSVEVLSVRHPIGTGEVTLAPSQMSVAVVATEGDANSGGPGMIFLGDGSVTFAVTLPLEASGMAVSELDIIVGPDPGMVLSEQQFGGGFWPPGFTAEVRDPQTGEWQLLGDLGADTSFEIEDPATAISPGGRIEVRVNGGEGVPVEFGQASVFVSAKATGVIAP